MISFFDKIGGILDKKVGMFQIPMLIKYLEVFITLELPILCIYLLCWYILA